MKYVKYAIIALAPVVLVVGLLFSMGSGDGLPNDITVVNVLTGEIQSFNRDSRPDAPPFRDESGERTLFPVSEVDGQYVVKSRYHERLVRKFSDKKTAVDLSTFVVQANN